jgi:hypothetical protein
VDPRSRAGNEVVDTPFQAESLPTRQEAQRRARPPLAVRWEGTHPDLSRTFYGDGKVITLKGLKTPTCCGAGQARCASRDERDKSTHEGRSEIEKIRSESS